MEITESRLAEILQDHKSWMSGNGGRRANLSRADLRGANLSEADLSGANLSGANLSGADLSEAVGMLATASFGRNHAIAAGGYISIGCERHTYQEWLDTYREIGKANDYTDAEIERYGAWIKLATDWLIEEEKGGADDHEA